MSVREPIKFKDLITDGAVFNVNLDDVKHSDDEDTEETHEYKELLSKFVNFDCVDPTDEDTYVEGQPFEIIGSKMTNITEKGEVKKRVLREGYGNKPSNLSVVKVHYNGYVEYEAEPFDSTYARKKPFTFLVNNGEVILGLDIAIQSMQLNEKSQFLVDHTYGYGPLGCLGRVPAKATILFEIELLEIVDSGASLSFPKLPEDKQKEFGEVYKYCLALCVKGKDLFKKNKNNAIKEFNMAAHKLEMCTLNDYDEQIKQQELLLRLYTNLLVCYTYIEEPKKGCTNFNKMVDLTRGTSVKLPAKAYYNNAKCLRMLGEFDLARKRLQIAYNMEPRSTEIASEFMNLENDKQEYLKNQAQMAKALFSSGSK